MGSQRDRLAEGIQQSACFAQQRSAHRISYGVRVAEQRTLEAVSGLGTAPAPRSTGCQRRVSLLLTSAVDDSHDYTWQYASTCRDASDATGAHAKCIAAAVSAAVSHKLYWLFATERLPGTAKNVVVGMSKGITSCVHT